MDHAYQERYSRQLSLTGFGKAGQEKLSRASVLVIGAGGLGCPALQYLVAAGTGRIGIADGDTVTLSNLHRQVLYTISDIGKAKADVAVARLGSQNPDTEIETYSFINTSNALQIISTFDLVVDGTDNFPSRYLINDACVLLDKPLVYGSVSRFEGQLAVFNSGNRERLNYRDLFPEIPGRDEVLNCEEAGVLGVLPGIIGTMQAAEAIKILTGTGEPITNRLLTFNLLRNKWMEVEITAGKDARRHLPKDEEAFRTTNYGPGPCHAPGIQDIDPEEFGQMIKRGDVLVIDVREKGEAPLINSFEHINMPLSDLRNNSADHHSRSIVLFCHSGIRSVEAAAFFPEDNVIYNLKGGIIRWLHYTGR